MRFQLLILGIVLALVLTTGNLVQSADEKNQFFNGKDLEAWDGLKVYWSLKDGTLVADAPKGIKFNTFLCSKQKYKDFELKFQIRLKDNKGNSGVQIRSKLDNKDKFTVSGPQCDIGDVYWGSLYGENFGGMMQAAPKDVVAKAMKKGEFNEYYIKCVGKKVTIKLNGETTVDAEFPKLPDEGIIAWQLHSGGAMEATFKDIQFKDLTGK